MAWIAKIFGSLLLKFSGLSTAFKAYIYFGAAAIFVAAWGFSLYKAYEIGGTVKAAKVTAVYEKAGKAYKEKIEVLEKKALAQVIESQAQAKKIVEQQALILAKAPKTKIVTSTGVVLNCVAATEIVTPTVADLLPTVAADDDELTAAQDPPIPLPVEDWYLDVTFSETWNAVIVAADKK